VETSQLHSLRGLVLSLATFSAFAQSPPEPIRDQPLEEIIVTGSYIRRTDSELPAPVTTITADQIQASGLTSVTDVIRALPADNNGTIPTAFGFGFAAGAAGVALRGLTVNSTLVLVNGRRAAAYARSDDGTRSFVDLNTLALNPVERIDVLKDGASSLYGADAIAGVVNLILDPSYVGTELTAEGGASSQGSGTTERLTAKFGHGDLETDRYNAYASVEWQKDDAIPVSSRGFPFNTNDLTRIGGFNFQAGVPGTATGTDYAAVQPATLSKPDDLLSGVPIPGSLIQTLRPCGPGTFAHNDENGSYCTENQARYRVHQPEQQRLGLYGRYTAQLSEDDQAYVDATYTYNQVTIPWPPSQINVGIPINTNAIVLPITIPGPSGASILNPNNPFAAEGQYALINYQFGDLAAFSRTANNFARIVAGATGTRWGWDYDTALVLNHTWLDQQWQRLLTYDGLLSAVTRGTYNFVDPTQNSSAVRKSIAKAVQSTATTDLDSLDLHVTRSLAQLPGGPLGIALGAEWRYEAQDNPGIPNPTQYLGGTPLVTKGSRDVLAAFMELDLPLLVSLDVNLSGRYDHYSDFGGHFAPKIGIKWTPVKQLAFRGTYSQGFRAPSFAESGDSIVEGFAPVTPPEDWAASHGNNSYTLPYNVGFLASPNPKLKPEESESGTFGVVVAPAPWLNLTLDYYVIRKTDIIIQSASSEILDLAFAGEPAPPGYIIDYDVPDPQYPDAVPRPLTVGAPYANGKSLQTDGLDLEVTARFDLPAGARLMSDLAVTKILSYNQVYSDAPRKSLQFVGTQGPYFISSGAGMPRYRGTWVNTVTFDKASVTATVYYTSGFFMSAPDITFDYSCFSTGVESQYLPANCRVDSFTDVDLTGSYPLHERLTASVAILNLFDADPPFNPINYAGINYNPTYHQAGIVGRFWKLGLAYRF